MEPYSWLIMLTIIGVFVVAAIIKRSRSRNLPNYAPQRGREDEWRRKEEYLRGREDERNRIRRGREEERDDQKIVREGKRIEDVFTDGAKKDAKFARRYFKW